MSERKCKECKYFMQHYGLNDGNLFQIYCGHCCYRRIRRKQPDSKVFENFVAGELNEAKFVKKEYLTKELLKQVLEMELLPDMEYLSDIVKERSGE